MIVINVLSKTLQYLDTYKFYNPALMNFTEVSVWRKKTIEISRISNSIANFPFFHDYEVRNPLGSHSEILKLNVVFRSLRIYVTDCYGILYLGV